MPLDAVHHAFFARQFQEGMALCRHSDLVELTPVDSLPAPQRYIVTLRCTGLCRTYSGDIVETNLAHVGLHFPDHYLRSVDGPIAIWLGPPTIWAPNIRAPWICTGRITPGTTLTAALYQLFEIVTYQRFSTHDALNRDAAAWARQHLDRFPVDRRALKRRGVRLTFEADTTGLPGPSASPIGLATGDETRTT
jgi:hypothetical protein